MPVSPALLERCKMFDFFKSKKNNVVPFPQKEGCDRCSLDNEVPPEKEKPATIFYRLGVTDKNRLAFQMGYSEITMNRQGVEHLIQQLQVFRDQLVDESINESNEE